MSVLVINQIVIFVCTIPKRISQYTFIPIDRAYVFFTVIVYIDESLVMTVC